MLGGAPAASDPLAELARLIGRSDPYAEFGRAGSQQGSSYPAGGSGREDQHYAPPERPAQPYQPAGFEVHGNGWEENEPDYVSGRSDWRTEQNAVDYAQDQPALDALDAAPDQHYYKDPALPDGGEEQIYDDPPRARRTGGLAMALVLIACAMVGTAGAYAYRSYHAHSGAAAAPPVITADNTTPTKIIPPSAADQQTGKAVQDRLADAGREQLVSKQEEPVARKDIGTQSAPRVVLPAPVAAAPPASSPSQESAPLTAPPSSNEPKKVRTLTIRPDGTEVAAKPTGAASQGGAATPSANSRPAGPVSTRGAPAPLSLDPAAEATPAPTAKTRTVTAPAPASTGTEVPVASSARFLVQLSSQKTEAEAMASFRSLQAKFSDELSGRAPIVRRVDLGQKGVFYRTMVGPFASAREANEFCAGFKAAGGHCVVPSN
jgi:hypothetical protein